MESDQPTKAKKQNNLAYAVAGNALLCSIITIVFVVAGGLLASFLGAESYSSNPFTGIALFICIASYVLCVGAFCILLPVLRMARYGWKATVSTLIIEFIIVFLLSCLTVWCTNIVNKSTQCTYSPSDDFSTKITQGISPASGASNYRNHC